MFDLIEQIIANHFEISHQVLLKGNTRPACDARHFLWYILHCVMGYSGKYVAKRYGVSARNVLYFSALIRDGIKNQSFYAKHYRQIQSALRRLDII